MHPTSCCSFFWGGGWNNPSSYPQPWLVLCQEVSDASYVVRDAWREEITKKTWLMDDMSNERTLAIWWKSYPWNKDPYWTTRIQWKVSGRVFFRWSTDTKSSCIFGWRGTLQQSNIAMQIPLFQEETHLQMVGLECKVISLLHEKLEFVATCSANFRDWNRLWTMGNLCQKWLTSWDFLRVSRFLGERWTSNALPKVLEPTANVSWD